MVDKKIIYAAIGVVIIVIAAFMLGQQSSSTSQSDESENSGVNQGSNPSGFCSDPDAQEIDKGIWEKTSVYGINSEGEWAQVSDYCVKREVNELAEMYCGEDNTIQERVVNCPNDGVCQGGVCVEAASCEDTDGGKYGKTSGTTKGYFAKDPDTFVEMKDTCLEPAIGSKTDRVEEYFCVGGFIESEKVECPKFYDCILDETGSAVCVEAES